MPSARKVRCEPFSTCWRKRSRLTWWARALPSTYDSECQPLAVIQAILVGRELSDHFGEFDTQFKIASDCKMIMQSLSAAARVFLKGVCVANQREGGKFGLRRNRVAALREFRKVRVDFGYPKSLPCLYVYFKSIVWLLATRTGIRSNLFDKTSTGAMSKL